MSRRSFTGLSVVTYSSIGLFFESETSGTLASMAFYRFVESKSNRRWFLDRGILLVITVVAAVATASATPRQITSLDADWRFHRGDIPGVLQDPPGREELFPSSDFLRPAYDDSSWQRVNVPHDYVIEGSFDPKADEAHGYLPVEPSWYRKTISIPATDKGRRLWIEFDGVYRDSQMWLNGHFLGRHASGYTSFHYDVSEIARPGADNLLVVRVDPTAFEGWW